VPAFAAFHEWLGRGEELRALHEMWGAGDARMRLRRSLTAWLTSSSCTAHLVRVIRRSRHTSTLVWIRRFSRSSRPKQAQTRFKLFVSSLPGDERTAQSAHSVGQFWALNRGTGIQRVSASIDYGD
jgi:hypothetical protein